MIYVLLCAIWSFNIFMYYSIFTVYELWDGISANHS